MGLKGANGRERRAPRPSGAPAKHSTVTYELYLNDGQMCAPGYPDRALVVLCSIFCVYHYDWMAAGGMTNPGPRVVAGAPHVT
jgi:hypothetical protein